MITLALLGMWFLAIVLILVFFAGGLRDLGTPGTATISPFVARSRDTSRGIFE